MKSFCCALLSAILSLSSTTNILLAQRCESWSDPIPLSDSLSDNSDAVMESFLYDGSYHYYVFWVRMLEVDYYGSDLVYTDYYDPDAAEAILHTEGYLVGNPQIIATSDWYPHTDTLAYIFYETGQNGNEDIYYIVMTDEGFTDPEPFAASSVDETHLRVSPGGGMVWQEGDAIRYSKLLQGSSEYYFAPVVTIDEGNCQNPDIHNSEVYSDEYYIVWEKGMAGENQVWLSSWSFENDEWGEPIVIFDETGHSNTRFSNRMDWASWNAMVISDWQYEPGQYKIHGYDCFGQDEFVTDFSQNTPFYPDVFTVDLITVDFWDIGYMAISHNAGMGNTDIYSSDYIGISPDSSYYCGIDITSQWEGHPQLFEGAWSFDAFDLVCIWESFRNGHKQLFTARTLVVVGDVPEPPEASGPQVKVYPNPFQDYFNVEIVGKSSVTAEIQVYSSYGQLVRNTEYHRLPEGVHILKISMEGFSSGIYFVRIKSDEGEMNLKVVKE